MSKVDLTDITLDNVENSKAEIDWVCGQLEVKPQQSVEVCALHDDLTKGVAKIGRGVSLSLSILWAIFHAQTNGGAKSTRHGGSSDFMQIGKWKAQGTQAIHMLFTLILFATFLYFLPKIQGNEARMERLIGSNAVPLSVSH